mgnify:CR=1 FL=1
MAAVVGKEFGDAASDFVIGESDPFIPGTSETGERAGELTTAMAAFSPIGFLTSAKANLGVEAAKTIAKEAGKKRCYGKVGQIIELVLLNTV